MKYTYPNGSEIEVSGKPKAERITSEQTDLLKVDCWWPLIKSNIDRRARLRQDAMVMFYGKRYGEWPPDRLGVDGDEDDEA